MTSSLSRSWFEFVITQTIQSVGKLMPNCFAALRLVETGVERPLKPTEKLALRYHSNLCLHCNCAQRKFDKLMDDYRDAEKSRKNPEAAKE